MMTRKDVGAADRPAQTAGRPVELNGVSGNDRDELIIRGRVVCSRQQAPVPMPAEDEVLTISDGIMIDFEPFARKFMRAFCTHHPFFGRQRYLIPGRRHKSPGISDHPTAAMEHLSKVSPPCELVA